MFHEASQSDAALFKRLTPLKNGERKFSQVMLREPDPDLWPLASSLFSTCVRLPHTIKPAGRLQKLGIDSDKPADLTP